MNFTHTSLAPDDKRIKMWEFPPLLEEKGPAGAGRSERPLKACFLSRHSQWWLAFFFPVWKHTKADTCACMFDVCLCTLNWLVISYLFIYLFIYLDGRMMGREVITIELVSSRSPSCETVSVSHHYHLSAQRIFKDSFLHFAFRANTFLMFPLRPLPPSLQRPQTPASNKQKKNKSWKTRQWGYQFWQSLLSAHSHWGRFVRLCEAAPWQLKHSSYLAVNFWNVVCKVAIDHVRFPFSGQHDEATRMIAWACSVNHAGNAVCLLVMLYWMWQRTSTGTRWHVVSCTHSVEKQKEQSFNRFIFPRHRNDETIGH